MADAEFERRASLAIIAQDLVTPVRAILGYQQIIVEEGRRLRARRRDPRPASGSGRRRRAQRSRRPDPRDQADAETGGDGRDGFQARLRHDLRTPLNAIIGYSEMVAGGSGKIRWRGRLRADLEKLLVAGAAAARSHRRNRGPRPARCGSRRHRRKPPGCRRRGGYRRPASFAAARKQCAEAQ